MLTVNQQEVLPMKKNDTINFLFLFLCVLLLGFVYLSSKMPERTAPAKTTVVQQTVQTTGVK